MKKFTVFFAAFITILLCGMCASAESGPAFDDSSVIVTLNSLNRGVKIAAFGSDIPDFGNIGVTDIDVLMSPPAGRIALMSLNAKPKILKLTLSENGAGSINDAIKKLESMPEVKYAEPNYYLKLCESDDPYYTNSSQYALDKVSAPDLWGLDIDCSNTSVAIIDSGARVTHEDLIDNIWTNPNEIPNNNFDDDGNGYIDDVHGWNCFSDNNDLSDNVSHGTHVAGIVSAATNNSKGVASVARNAKIAVIKAFDKSETTVDMIIKGIDYADTMGFKTVNASFTTMDQNFIKSMGSAIEACPDTLFVCAAGNSSLNIDVNPAYPASYDFPNVLAVANTTKSGALSASSNYGAKTVDIAAPGDSIMSTINTSDSAYGLKSGTSMASPLAASAAAVVLAANPNLTPSEVIEILTKSADPGVPLDGKVKGAAHLNAHKAALMSIESTATPEPTESPKPSEMPIYSESPAPSGSIEPSAEPISSNTPLESTEPSAAPSEIPIETTEPSAIPTELPIETSKPSHVPIETTEPSAAPSQTPTETTEPSAAPSQTPTETTEPSAAPSQTPSETTEPSATPSQTPIETTEPSAEPSQTPSETTEPSVAPSQTPSETTEPSATPSQTPIETTEPSAEPSQIPIETTEPSAAPSQIPIETTEPSAAPSQTPSETTEPSAAPSQTPIETTEPSAAPSQTPIKTTEPTITPSSTPGTIPTPIVNTVTINGAETEQDGIRARILGHSGVSRNIICAAYDSNGALTDIAFEDLPPFDNEAEIKIPIKVENAAMFKIMIWNSIENIKPLCESFTI